MVFMLVSDRTAACSGNRGLAGIPGVVSKPVVLLGAPKARGGPSQSLLEGAEAMFQVEAPDVRRLS